MADEYPALRRFILPEKEVSLKLVFDNARNYVIVGAFVAMARWFASGKATVPPMFFSDVSQPRDRTIFVFACFAVAGILFLLNAVQSCYIVTRLILTKFGEEGVDYSKHPGHVRVWMNVISCCILAALFMFVLMLMRLAIYMVWFSAVGSGR
jgi:hypothetical protein